MDARVAEAPVSATLNSWRRERGDPSLSEVHRIDRGRGARAAVAQVQPPSSGPAISSPSATWTPATGRPRSPAARKFGYALLFVALVSNIMAIVLQSLCARAWRSRPGRDLAQACRDAFPRPVAWPLWVLAEIAICATDLAEVIGTAIGLNLLFGIPLEIGVHHHRARRVPDPLAAEPGLPLDRGLDHHAARRHRGLLRRPDRAGRSGLGRGDPRLRADDARSSPIRRCSTSRSASSARR